MILGEPIVIALIGLGAFRESGANQLAKQFETRRRGKEKMGEKKSKKGDDDNDDDAGIPATLPQVERHKEERLETEE